MANLSVPFNVHATSTTAASSDKAIGVKNGVNSSRNFCFSKSLRGMANKRSCKTTAAMAANGSGNGSGSQLRFSLSSINFRTEEDLLLGIKRAREAGTLSLKVSEGMEELYLTYRNAVCKSGNPKAHEIALSNTALAFQCIFMDMKDPFEFAPHHKAIRQPFDYYIFGQNYIRPLIDFRNSYVGNICVFYEIEEKLKKGENIILISNHQTEADPAIIALLLESKNPYLSENMTYVAGDRVVTDPLCKPFSMGRNLICVYSKKHMCDDPELIDMKRTANRRSLKEMSSLLKKGSQIIWIAPSGGRDRPNPKTQKCRPAQFDASVVDSMRRLLEKAGVPGHIYPMALLCYDIMPPPEQVEKIIGEKRIMAFHGVGISVGHKTNFFDVVSSEEPIEVKWEGCRQLAMMAKVELYTKALYTSVNHQYKVLKSAIYENNGLEASTADVSLSQPFQITN